MRLDKCALLCALLVLSVIVDPIIAKRSGFGSRGGSPSYPRSGGLSGGGSHGYPSSGGLSGGSHGYPASGGLSGTGRGTGSHAYPPAGNSHGYPASGGLSGSGSNTHHSNSHGYPAGSGLAGKAPVTNVHHHYNYSPPQRISYAPTHGSPPVNYPVYHGQPPTYVYQYKNSGTKYGTLLAGLALLNLGALGATAYAASHSHSNNYKPQPGEICKFGVKKDNGDYEETKIDCQLITSFIFQDQQANTQNGTKNMTITTTTVTNTTILNATNGAPETSVNQTAPVVNPLYERLPNGTFVEVNKTQTNDTVTTTGAPVDNNNSMSSSVVVMTTMTNTTVVNALDAKGKEVEVTPGMQCFVIRQTSSSKMKKTVPCGLLQSYATQSLKKNSAGRNIPAITILAAVVAAFVMH